MPIDSPPQTDAASGDPWPSLDAAARAQSDRLLDLIQQEVGRGGAMPFDRYMELALYAPGLGYYMGGARKFGMAGDFITAPEVSPLFARCLANQCREVLAALAGDTRLLEFGAGSGRLAVDLMLALERLESLPERYMILELSPDLRARQRALIQQQVPHLFHRVQWLERLPDTAFRGVVIANEVLDAMPVQRFRVRGGVIEEQFVRCEQRGLQSFWDTPTPGLGEAARCLLAGLEAERDDYESEICQRAPAWIEAVAGAVAAGAILLIDYGYTRNEYYHPQRNRGTLMCHYRHRAHSDPLRYPGLQDITSHVDFSALAMAAQATGLSLCGYSTQAFFLLGSGLERLLAASDPNDIRNHMQLMQGVKRLTLPSEMGERFKVMGLCRGLDTPLLGFGLQDHRNRL